MNAQHVVLREALKDTAEHLRLIAEGIQTILQGTDLSLAPKTSRDFMAMVPQKLQRISEQVSRIGNLLQ